jgi:single-strand DNA-binding protein
MAERGLRVIGDGVLTANPEVRTAGNSNVANFNLAFNFAWGRGDEQRRDTTFVECEAWGWLAGFFGEQAQKGTKVNVEGRMIQKSWEQDGKKRSKLVLRIEHANIITKISKGNGQSSNQGESGGQSAPPINRQVESNEPEVCNEDMPF